jgi:hypothetical protein
MTTESPRLSWRPPVIEPNTRRDINTSEDSTRLFVIGINSWFFSETVAEANARANLYSLMQTCALNDVHGCKYLQALLVALPKAQTADD